MSPPPSPTLAVLLAAAIACTGDSAPAPSPGAAPVTGAAAASSSAAAAGSTAGATVSGTAAPASGGFPSVVSLEPAGGGAERAASSGAAAAGSPPAPGEQVADPLAMDQIASAFYPPTLLAPVGGTVQFWNSEGVMHNVHVADAAGITVFNVAMPPGFESYEHAFAAPGVYRVSCDIHPNMTAFIVAVATPHAAVAGADGRFSIRDVPPGRYEATVWSADASRRVTRAVEIAGDSVELDLRWPPERAG